MSIFKKLEKAIKDKSAGRRSGASRQWLLQQVKNMKASRNDILNDKGLKNVKSLQPGYMYFYEYDPKHKKTLPYYDRFPLIILLDATGNGFNGLNLHYLPPVTRARFLDKLMETTSDKKLTEKTRMQITMNLLQSTKKFREFAPCHKNYLFSHVKSQMKLVPANYWEMISFLPVEKFEKQTKNSVWQESRKQIFPKARRR